MVIIMMPNKINMVMQYVASFLISILASYLFLKWTQFKYRPKIEIGKEVALRIEDDEKYDRKVPTYRLKIKNCSNREVFSIKTTLRIRYRGKYLTIELPSVPVLYGNRQPYAADNVERVLPFRLTQIKKDRILTINEKSIQEKYENGSLNFTDFNQYDTVVEIILSASDGVSGIVLNQSFPPIPIHQFIKSIKNGSFSRGSMNVSDTGATESIIYGDNY